MSTHTANYIPTEEDINTTKTIINLCCCIEYKIRLNSLNELIQIISSPDFNCQLFIQIRNQYIGITNISDDINKYIESILLYAALLTNSPTLIDSFIMQFNINFTPTPNNNDDVDQKTQINMNNTSINTSEPNQHIYKVLLHLANDGQYQSIKYLIEHHQLSPNDIAIRSGINLFYHATNSKSQQLIEYLLPLYISTTTTSTASRASTTTLTQSIFNLVANGHLSVLKQLHQHCNINLTQLVDNREQNLLHVVDMNNFELIDYLIELGVDLYHEDRSGETPYVQFIRSLNRPLIEHLINKHQIDINNQNDDDDDDDDSIHLANCIVTSDTPLTPDEFDYFVKLFKKDNDDIQDEIDTCKGGSLLYHLVCDRNLPLLKHIVKKYNADINYIHDEGNNLIHSLLLSPPNKSHPVTTETNINIQIIKFLHQHRVSINVSNKNGYYPIDLAIRFGDVDIVKWFLAHGCHFHCLNTVLLSIIHDDISLSMVKYLIDVYSTQIINGNEILFLESVLQGKPSLNTITQLLKIIKQHKKSQLNTKTLMLASRTAFENNNIDINIIKLLVANGATITRDDWLNMFEFISPAIFTTTTDQSPHTGLTNGLTQFDPKSGTLDPIQIWDRIDYANEIFQHNIEQFKPTKTAKTSPILIMSQLFDFPFKTIFLSRKRLSCAVLYRSLISNYKANVNDQHYQSKSTVFHFLASNRQYEFIQFTLLNSFQKPDIFLVNKKGKTFLHCLFTPKKTNSRINGSETELEAELEHILINVVDVLE